MKILESRLMGEFISYLKTNWGGNSRVRQRRRRLRQLIIMVRGVANVAEGRRATLKGGSLNLWLHQLRMEALRGQAVLDATSDPSAVVGSARKFLAGIRTLFVCSAEVDRLTDAVEGLEHLAGHLPLFLEALQVETARDVDVKDAAAAPYVEQGSYSVATEFPVPGTKRKRAGGRSGVDQAETGDGDATSHGRLVDPAPSRHKRRALACKRHHRSCPPPESNSPLAVAVAMARVRSRIGKRNLARRVSLISLQGR